MRARIYIITYNSIMDCILTNYHTILFVEGLFDLLHTFLFPSLLPVSYRKSHRGCQTLRA